MTNYTPQDLFSQSLIVDNSDPVKGGIDGASNQPLIALADRTQYLYNRQGLIVPKRITGAYTFDVVNDLNTLLTFHISANTAFNLPDVSALRPGTVVRITARIPVVKALTINCNGSQKIYAGSSDLSAMYMHDAEHLHLVAAALDNGNTPDHWEIDVADGNFFTAGESLGARFQIRNTVVNDGTIYNRADMPRLWLAASAMGNGIVSDLTWLSDPGGKPVYRGCFSNGNGVSTFRVADDRAMSDRYLDLGRGIDNNRLYNYPGGYGPDTVGPHDHPANATDSNVYFVKRRQGGPGGGLGLNGVNGFELAETRTGVSSGVETAVKSIGKIPLTRY